jgi:long-subunit fatty acid transport protein
VAQKTSPYQKKGLITFRIICFLLVSSVYCIVIAKDDNGTSFGVPSRTTVGVGARAYAMGNNYVALSDDATAIFWNPAGLAFTPVREFQISLSGVSHYLDSELRTDAETQKSKADRQRIHFNNMAYLRALPTTRGGFSLAFGYQSPYLIDDIFKYSVKEVSGNRTDYKYYSFGQMSLWTASFGMQIAEDLGIGAAVSLITGQNRMNLYMDYFPSIGTDSTYEGKIKQRYLGADVRVGIMFSLFERAKIGMRIVAPQYLVFSEVFEDETIIYDTVNRASYYSEDNTGLLKTSFSGAFGASYRFPFMLLSSEFRVRSPIPDADDESYYAHWKIGAGAGVEIPLFIESLLLRGGYSWQEYDRNPMLIEYEITPPDFNTEIGIVTEKDEHLITAGIAYLTKNGFSFDISYGYQFWELSTWETLFEKHSSHRVIASFAIRF